MASSADHCTPTTTKSAAMERSADVPSPGSDEELMLRICEFIWKRADSENYMNIIHTILGISKEKYVELTNSRDFEDLLERTRWSFMVLPNYKRMMGRFMKRAMSGDDKSFERLMSPPRYTNGTIKLKETREVTAYLSQVGDMLVK